MLKKQNRTKKVYLLSNNPVLLEAPNNFCKTKGRLPVLAAPGAVLPACILDVKACQPTGEPINSGPE
ncbi:MAG: hypothetical protein KIPDCIKN_00755 [Haliscomenobacter sp.]|jgi:hypothetical protein|nr:hypothetical protein [Haliscomenobacter sp.]